MTVNTDHMAPGASPSRVRSGVRRVNNVPMYILGSVFLSFLLVMALVAAERAAKQNAPQDVLKEKAGNTAMFAKEIAGDKTGGLIAEAGPLTAPAFPGSSVAAPLDIARPVDLDLPPAPPSAGHLDQPANNDEEQRIRQGKLQMFAEAVKAKTTVRVDAPRSSGSPPGSITSLSNAPLLTRDEMLNRIATAQQQIEAQRSDDPTAAYQARLAQIRNPRVAEQSPSPQLVPTSTAGGRNSYSQFNANGLTDRWKLNTQPEAPRSAYELRTGFVIPATLISGINSELPGQIMAQVSQNVFDTPTGRWNLIPQGSRLVGQYSSDVIYGQSRVLVAWQRIIFPDGKALDIGSMPGADHAGYAGFNDKVNNHYVRIFGSALLMSGITAGIAISQNCDEDQVGNSTSSKCALTDSLGQQLGTTTAALISKNLNIAPTLEIRPGYRFNVIVTKDLTFSKPYQSFDY